VDEKSTERALNALERIALVLAAMYADRIPDADQGERARRLSHLGFSNSQIAEALGVTSNAINVALHRARKGAAGTEKRKSKKTAKP
jgi:DNA-directed RNA polymerase specialized sigma24 family protein